MLFRGNWNCNFKLSQIMHGTKFQIFCLQFKNHKYYKRGFLAYSILVENIDDENSAEVAFFNNMINAINDECSKIRNPDRCDYAYEFAKCFDLVMGGVNDDRNVLFSDGWEHEKNQEM